MSKALSAYGWRFIYRCRDAHNRVRFGPGAPQCAQRLYTDPNRITQYLRTRPRRHDTGRVIAGDWDLNVKPLNQLEKVVICQRHFVDGLSWEDAGAYDLLARMLAKKQKHDGCRTMEDVKRRYEAVDRLYEHLRSGGEFLTQEQLAGRSAFREDRGIYVHIGRAGELIFGRGGCHRLAIAQILGLPQVPVQVGVIHRDAVVNGQFLELTKGQSEAS